MPVARHAYEVRWPALVGCVALLGLASSARADEAPPSAERLRSAAAEYDAGRRAFGEKDYEGAAAHFENAFHDAANAAALRNAIRARKKAGQLSRAATLAYIASARYPRDTQTAAVVREVLNESQTKLDRVTVQCTPACGVAADGRAISQDDAAQNVFYLDPGSHDLVVSWGDDRSKRATLTAKAGGQDELTFEAPPKVVAAPPAAAVVVAPPAPPPASPKPLPPAVFLSAAGATAIALGVTVWSGINTINSPGVNAVRADCVGQGASCPAYVEGRNEQLRTNVLIGVTAGLGAATGVIGLFFTRWSHAPEKAPTPIGGSFTPLPGGGAVGLSGRF